MTTRISASVALATLLTLGAACSDDESETADEVPWPVQEPACEGFELLGAEARDLRTGLVWDRLVRLSFATHEEASASCAARGARLPTREELLALRQPQGGDACQLPSCPFQGDRCATLQCGSLVPGSDDDHWGVTFSGGSLVLVPSGQPQSMICVR